MTATRRKSHNRHGVPTAIAERLMTFRAFNHCLYRLKLARNVRFVDDAVRFDSERPNRITPQLMWPESFMWLVSTRIQSSWTSDAVVALLNGIPQDMSILPTLADALEENGCDDYDLLSTLRGEP